MSPLCVVLAVLTVTFAAGCIALQCENKAFAGAVLFILSGTCLDFLCFTPVKKMFFTIELLTYYAAQVLFAMTVALLKQKIKGEDNDAQ